MDEQDDLCEECARINPVGVLVDGDSPPDETSFTLADNRQCMFCSLCIGALNSTRAAVGKPCLEGPVKVTLEVERRWDYSMTDKPSCEIDWINVSVVDDLATASCKGHPVATPESIHIQTIRNGNGCISDEGCYYYGRRVYDEIDLGLVKFWMSQCASNHGDACKSLPLRPDLPEYLIDTSTLMLVPKTNHPRYAALSYCWGNAQVPQLRLKDLKDLAPNRNSWSIGALWAEVPQTIKDAILLCQLLSIPYLWVDAMCILHDRPAQSALCDTHLAQQMRSIYESADLTIVAAAGSDSWAGLPGLRAGTRSVGQHVARLHDAVLANVLGSADAVIPSSTWSTRAWTLQESLLSNRLLIFTEKQCFWSCNWSDATFCEDIHREIEPANLSVWRGVGRHMEFRDNKQSLLACPGLNIHEHYDAYVGILADYTGRNLTYQQDALEAFGGIASFLSRSIATSFFWGVPLRFFEQALLFHPGPQSQAPLTRRRQFPSWSWAGWQFEDEKSDRNYITCDSWVGTRGGHWWSLDDFRSLIQWYRFKRVIHEVLMEFEVVQGIETPVEGGAAGACPTHRTSLVPSFLQPSHVLLFDAMTARLDLRCHESKEVADHNTHLVSIYIPGGHRELGTVRLGTGWNEVQALDFVAIAQETREIGAYERGRWQSKGLKEVIHALLIETDIAGISERKHMFTLDKLDWDAASPKLQTIFLV